MKHSLLTKIRLALLLLALVPLATSCLKEGLNDFEGLRHPMQITGTFNPELGLPIGQADINITDLLGLFNETSGIIEIDPQTGAATVHYDTTFLNIFDVSSTKHRGKSTVPYQRSVQGTMDFDLFSNIDVLPETFRLEKVFLTLTTDIMAHAPPATQNLLNNYDVFAYFDNIVLTAVNSTTHQSYTLPIIQDSIPINNMLTGASILVIDSVDASDFLNIKPDCITYNAQLNINFGTAFWASDITQFLSDSLGLSTIDVNSHLSIYSPLTIFFSDASYNAYIGLDANRNDLLEQLQIDSSYLVFEFVNGLPLQLNLSASLTDADSHALVSLFENGVGQLNAAAIGFNAATQSYTATTPTTSIVRVPITSELLQSISKASNIHLLASLSTAADANVSQPAVSIIGSDALAVRVYATLRPHVNITYPIGADSIIISK